MLTDFYTKKSFPEKLRRVKHHDFVNEKRLEILTNNFSLPVITIANHYKCWWQVELLFKWIMQHLRIKANYGISENADKSQIWIAVSVYVLIAMIKKRLNIEQSLYTILQILSVSILRKCRFIKCSQILSTKKKLLHIIFLLCYCEPLFQSIK